MSENNQDFRRVTIGDVALLAQVSEATVSRVLNNNPTVSTSNRQAVLAAAEELGYTPRKKSPPGTVQSMAMCLGSVRPDNRQMLAGNYFSLIVESIEAACREKGINLLLMSLKGTDDDLLEIQRLIHQGSVDSLLLVHVLEPDVLEAILALNIPCVSLNSYFPWLPIDSVNSDAFSGMLLAMQYLLDNGHEQIAFIDGSEDCQDHWVCMRRVAYQHALHRAGIAYDPALVAYGNLSHPGGERAMRQLLETGKSFSAVLC